MKAFISIFPQKIVVSLPNGTIFSSHDEDELCLSMIRAGIVGSQYEWIEHVWDKKMFPVLATWTQLTDGTIVSSLPNGVTFTSKNEDEILSSIVQAGATGLVSGYTSTSDPIEHRSETGDHLFTDRGNNLTFDRERVSDEEIRLALVHAKAKYGVPLKFSGNDPIFTARMARIAGDMKIAIAK